MRKVKPFVWDNVDIVKLTKEARCSAPVMFVITTLPTTPKGAEHRNIIKPDIPVRCTFKIPGWANNLQTFRGAAASALKVSPFRKGETFLAI